MKKRLLALSLALVMVFVLAACGESTTDPSAEPSTAPSAAVSVGPADVPDVEASANLQFGTGSPTGTYYGFGSTFGTYISNNTGVSITAIITNKNVRFPTARATPGWLFSPILRPINTVPPIAIPCTSAVTVIISCEPIETADTAAESAYCPTTNRSTAP